MNGKRGVLLAGGIAAGLSALASLWLGLWPGMYQSVSVSVGPTGEETVVTTSSSLIAVNGYRVVPLLMAPVAATLLGVLAISVANPLRRGGKIAIWTPAVLLFLFCLVGLASIGLFYVPSAIALLVAVVLASRRSS